MRLRVTVISTFGCGDDGVLVCPRSLSPLLSVGGTGGLEDDDDEPIEVCCAKCEASIWCVGAAGTTQPMTTTTQPETKAETSSEVRKWE